MDNHGKRSTSVRLSAKARQLVATMAKENKMTQTAVWEWAIRLLVRQQRPDIAKAIES